MITIIFTVVSQLLRLYWWAVIIAGIFQNLVAFGVLDTRNRLVWSIGDFFYRITEPALRPIRRFVPHLGGVDLSYIVLLILLWVAQMVLARLYEAIALGNVNSLVY